MIRDVSDDETVPWVVKGRRLVTIVDDEGDWVPREFEDMRTAARAETDKDTVEVPFESDTEKVWTLLEDTTTGASTVTGEESTSTWEMVIEANADDIGKKARN